MRSWVFIILYLVYFYLFFVLSYNNIKPFFLVAPVDVVFICWACAIGFKNILSHLILTVTSWVGSILILQMWLDSK